MMRRSASAVGTMTSTRTTRREHDGIPARSKWGHHSKARRTHTILGRNDSGAGEAGTHADYYYGSRVGETQYHHMQNRNPSCAHSR